MIEIAGAICFSTVLVCGAILAVLGTLIGIKIMLTELLSFERWKR